MGRRSSKAQGSPQENWGRGVAAATPDPYQRVCSKASATRSHKVKIWVQPAFVGSVAEQAKVLNLSQELCVPQREVVYSQGGNEWQFPGLRVRRGLVAFEPIRYGIWTNCDFGLMLLFSLLLGQMGRCAAAAG